MSEPMTSGEIEDVLSSIRKLVSDDLRPQSRPPVTPTAPPASDAGKLLLTPALRVVEPAVAEPARRLRLDGVVSTVAAQVSPPAGGWEAETGDATVTHLLRATPEAFPDIAADDDTPIPGAAPEALHFTRQARRAGFGDDAPQAGDQPGRAEGIESMAGLPESGSAAAQVAALDADALGDLVRDILRDELQGALGERMTRNIRKLVRAEVARMLAARDLA